MVSTADLPTLALAAHTFLRLAAVKHQGRQGLCDEAVPQRHQCHGSRRHQVTQAARLQTRRRRRCLLLGPKRHGERRQGYQHQQQGREGEQGEARQAV